MLFDYASNDGLTLKPRLSRRYPAEKRLDYADDIAFPKKIIEAA